MHQCIIPWHVLALFFELNEMKSMCSTNFLPYNCTRVLYQRATWAAHANVQLTFLGISILDIVSTP